MISSAGSARCAGVTTKVEDLSHTLVLLISKFGPCHTYFFAFLLTYLYSIFLNACINKCSDRSMKCNFQPFMEL